MAEGRIQAVKVDGTGFEERWNVPMVEYKMAIDGKLTQIDFQDLMVNVTEQQALAIEQEVKPASERITRRTKRLKVCGDAMAELAAFKFDTKENSNPSASSYVSTQTQALLNELVGRTWGNGECGKSVSRSKSQVDSGNQYLKSESDKLNNEQQLAMSRLESLVQSRDQNFNTASTLMNHISETRGSLIKSLA